MDPMRRWDLLRPINEYTAKELSFLDQIQSCSRNSREHFWMFDANRKKMNYEAIAGMSVVQVHEFQIEAENLCQSVSGTLNMGDLDCIERPFRNDEEFVLREDVMTFLIAELAEQQHYSLVSQTLVIDFAQKLTPKYHELEAIVTDLRMTHDMPNPFDKDLLIFPSFRSDNSYVTIVKNPKGAFANSGDDDPAPLMYHFATGDMRSFNNSNNPDSLEQVIIGFLHFSSMQYCPESDFRSEKIENMKVELDEVQNDDKPFVILRIIRDILAAEFDFPNLKDIRRNLLGKSKTGMKEHAQSFRLDMAELFRNTIEPSPVAQEMLDFRQEIIDKSREAQDSTISSSTD